MLNGSPTPRANAEAGPSEFPAGNSDSPNTLPPRPAAVVALEADALELARLAGRCRSLERTTRDPLVHAYAAMARDGFVLAIQAATKTAAVQRCLAGARAPA